MKSHMRRLRLQVEGSGGAVGWGVCGGLGRLVRSRGGTGPSAGEESRGPRKASCGAA